MPALIALVGDYSPDVIAHRAIPLALDRASRELAAQVSWRWFSTREIGLASRDLSAAAAVWVVPASPYENMSGALDAIRFARESRRPFLGTCGGLQHALIEFARNVGSLGAADHAETNPQAETLVVTRLTCSLIEQTGALNLIPGTLIHAAYGRDTALEGYRCNYGFNATYRGAFERAGLRFSAFDPDGEIRAAELPTSMHPFFIGTLFQPERAALRGETPPLVRAFVAATIQSQSP